MHNQICPTAGRFTQTQSGLRCLLLLALLLLGNCALLTSVTWAASGDITTVAGNGTRGFSGDGGLAATTYHFRAVATNSAGTTNGSDATFTTLETPSLIVTTLGDVVDNTDGLTSLREAISFANARAGADTIGFATGVRGTITLSQIADADASYGPSALLVTDQLTINGPGASLLAIERNGGAAFRLIRIAPATNFTLSGLTLRGGSALGAPKANQQFQRGREGGGILVADGVPSDPTKSSGGTLAGAVSVSDCVFSGNSAGRYGGGFYADEAASVVNAQFLNNTTAEDGGGFDAEGTVKVSGSTFSGNTTTVGGDGGAFYAGDQTTLSGSQFTGNSAADDGGAVYANDVMSVSNSSFDCNRSDSYGGAVYADGDATVSDCVFRNNSNTSSDDNDGGAVYADENATVSGCTFTGNSASDRGGGLFAFGDTATVNGCTFSGNTATSSGGAVFTSIGSLNLQNSTFNGNGAAEGGGLYLEADDGETISATNCTFSGNTASSGGGNLYVYNGTATIESCTFTLGSAPAGRGGGLACFSDNSTAARLHNTIVAGNNASDVDFVDGPNNTISSTGYNLIGSGNAAGVFNKTGDQTGVSDPGLAALAANGGPTQTHALQRTSPALSAGDTDLALDQRGQARPQGGADDIGAFESNLGGNTAPSVRDIAISLSEDAPRAFAATDFDGGFTDADAGDTTQSVSIVTLPTKGTLTFNGTAVVANQTIARADIAKLSYAPAANFFGADSFGYNASDGTAFAAQSAKVNLTIGAINDAPSFTVGNAQNINEDAGAQNVVGFATDISAGPTNESGQTLSFVVSTNNTALFSVQPAITPDGTLNYTPAPNANGAASVTVILKDNGGVADGGTDASLPQNFSIVVSAVNDAPSLELGNDPIVAKNVGAQSIAGFARNLSAGPADESGQTLNFVVTNDNNALFSVQPTIAPDGTLSFTPATDASGSAQVSVILHDSGGTANGGADSSAPRVFTITVTSNSINFGVSIVPNGPFTRDTVTAQLAVVAGTRATYSYEWFVNGASVQSGASRKLNLAPPGFGDKGDKITVTVTATTPSGGAGTATNFAIVRNSPPVAFSGTTTAKSGEETLIRFAPSGNPGGADADFEDLTYKRVGGPTNGTGDFFANEAGQTFLRYKSRRGFVGVEVVRFVAVDGQGRTSNVATLSIDVQGTPFSNPSAQDATGKTTSGVQVDVRITGSDPGGGKVTFKRVGGPKNGTGELVTLPSGTTVMRYTPRANFVGVEEIRFVALNSDGRPSKVATIRISVSASASGASAIRAGNAPSGGGS